MSQNIIRCKTCGAGIAKSAKVCPYCGAKRKTHTALGILGIILIIIAVLILAFANGEGDPQAAEDNQVRESVSPSSVPKDDVFSVGDKASLGGVDVTLVSVSENNGGNYMTPSDGKVFIVCEFNIENNSDKDIAVSSMLSFDAYIDDYAANMNLSAMLSTGQTQLDGTVAAGKKMNGVIGYEADPDWSNIEIRFAPDFWSGKKIVFSASK